ncbi:MAG: Lrp/AsnC family leucine-responsive transcriptional regulator [Paracoccaceae bacterium]|jgi:Lrp/AsnC family leucine-responsive transcriptional regulator
MIKKSDEISQLDQYDLRIIAELKADGRLAVTELAQRVGLSKTPCQMRLRRLQSDGFILGFRAVLDPEKLGMSNVAFIEIRLKDTTEASLAAFNKAVRAIPEIEQCHMIAGAFDYLLKVRTRTIAEYRKTLGEKISNLPHVASSSTHVSMESVKDEVF